MRAEKKNHAFGKKLSYAQTHLSANAQFVWLWTREKIGQIITQIVFRSVTNGRNNINN